MKRARKIPARKAQPARLSATLALADSPLPGFIEPCLATLVDKPPSGNKWIHEVKFDGYRIQAHLNHGVVKLKTRKGLDWTRKFATIATAIARLKAKTALIDGELVSLDGHGISSFSLLQQDLTASRHSRMTLYVFDLMHLDGANLKAQPLAVRKAQLHKLLLRSNAGRALSFSRSLSAPGATLLKQACKAGQEGIIAKRIDASYHSGRGRDWLKIKCSDRQELVVAGFAPSSADAHAVGALVLGVHDGGRLHYVGRTGTGFTHDSARALYRKFKAHERQTSPFNPVPKEERGARAPIWIEPKFVAEVDFHGWTHGGRIRQASFQGLRTDKAAKDVVRERTR